MKNRWLLLISVFVVLIVVGWRVYFYLHGFRTVSGSEPRVTTEVVKDLVGILGVATDEGKVLLTLSDGEQETLQITNNLDASGVLFQIDEGVRDLATHVIQVQKGHMLEPKEIMVTAPLDGATILSPLSLYGFSQYPDQPIYWTVRNAAQQVVDQGTFSVIGQKTDTYGFFHADLFLPALTEAKFTLELSHTEKQPVISLPLRLLSTTPLRFSVFFVSQSALSRSQCGEVVAVSRQVASTSAMARAAVLELLRGPTFEEESRGLRSFWPDTTQLISLTLNQSRASVHTSVELPALPSDCARQAALTQLTETLLQFPAIGYIDLNL